MKKLLLAVAVSTVAAGSVNAATVYEKDGFTYKLNGDFQIQFRQATGFDERAEVEYDDMELKVDTATARRSFFIFGTPRSVWFGVYWLLESTQLSHSFRVCSSAFRYQ